MVATQSRVRSLICKILPRFLRLFRVRLPTLPGRFRGPGRSAPSPPPDVSRREWNPGSTNGGRVWGNRRGGLPNRSTTHGGAYGGATPPFRLRRGCEACRPLLRFAEGWVLSCVDFGAGGGPGSLGVRGSIPLSSAMCISGMWRPPGARIRRHAERRVAIRGAEGAQLITSSARASTAGGIVRPSALAVFKLITSSNLVGCSMGRPAGLAPLRILSTYVAERRKLSRRSTA
jgi:hypothetical protein